MPLQATLAGGKRQLYSYYRSTALKIHPNPVERLVKLWCCSGQKPVGREHPAGIPPPTQPGADDNAHQSTEQLAATEPSPWELPQSILKVNKRASRPDLTLAGNLLLPAPHKVQQKLQTAAQRSHNSSWPIRQAVRIPCAVILHNHGSYFDVGRVFPCWGVL